MSLQDFTETAKTSKKAGTQPTTKFPPTFGFTKIPIFKKWSRLPDSNRGPHPYHGCALPTELSRRLSFINKNGGRSWI